MSVFKKQINLISQEEKQLLLNKFYILKNTVFISNIPKEIFTKEILYQKKFLGQYGHINQMFLINNNKIEHSVITQFDTVNQAALAIIALNNFEINQNNKIKISYFNIRYCHYFLNNKECQNPNCLFIHTSKINDYIYKEINVNEYFNSFHFALSILNVSLESFKIISEKIIGEKYFEKYKKFPKMTVKKLKNEENLKHLNRHNINLPNQKMFQKNKNSKKIKSKSYENSLKNLENLSNKKKIQIRSMSNKMENSKTNLIDNRTKHSRFFFAKKDANIDDKVNVPDFVINAIDKYLKLYIIDNKFNYDLIKTVNTNFNSNWSDLILIKNLY